MPKSSRASRHPRSFSRPDLAAGLLGVLGEQRLGDLEGEQRGVQARPLQRLGDVPDQVGVLELAHRDVHAHAQPAERGAVLPLGGLPGGLLEHPAPDRHDQAGLLGQRDEVERRHQAALGVAPPEQRLEADDLLRRDVDDRLVVQLQLLGVEGPGELRPDGVPLDVGRVVARLEDLEPALAAGLGRVHGHVGGAEHADAAGGAGRRGGEPDAESGAHQVLTDRGGCPQRVDHAVRRRARPGASCPAR